MLACPWRALCGRPRAAVWRRGGYGCDGGGGGRARARASDRPRVEPTQADRKGLCSNARGARYTAVSHARGIDRQSCLHRSRRRYAWAPVTRGMTEHQKFRSPYCGYYVDERYGDLNHNTGAIHSIAQSRSTVIRNYGRLLIFPTSRLEHEPARQYCMRVLCLRSVARRFDITLTMKPVDDFRPQRAHYQKRGCVINTV